MSFAVVIATYNRPALLLRAVNSVLAAERYHGSSIEIIVVDDCSPKPLPELPAKVRVLRSAQNSGPGPARMNGIRAATADLIVVLDDDDLLELKAFERLSAHFSGLCSKSSTVTMFTTNSRGFLGEERTLSLDDYFSGRVVGDLVPVISRTRFLDEGLSYPALRAGGEGILWMDIAARLGGIPVKDIPIVEVTDDAPSRLTDTSSQLKNAEDLRTVALIILERYGNTLKSAYPALYMNRVYAVVLYSLVLGDRERVKVFVEEIDSRVVRAIVRISAMLPRLFGVFVFKASRWLQQRRGS